jgi:hypothetical protein
MGAAERIKIQIDGSPVGDIGNNEELQIPVSKGNHRITSDSFLRSKAIPLEIFVLNNEEIEITIEPSSDKNKFQFYLETKIPFESQLSEFNLLSRTLAWDFGKELFIRNQEDPWVYFDHPNHAFLHALRVEINFRDETMQIFANRKQKLSLYESRVDWFEVFENGVPTTEKAKVHSFFREDGTLLGYLYQDGNAWFVSSEDLEEKLAEICMSGSGNNMFFNEDHYLQSCEQEVRILAYKKITRRNLLHIQILDIPAPDYQEILTLAYLKYAVLALVNQNPVSG